MLLTVSHTYWYIVYVCCLLSPIFTGDIVYAYYVLPSIPTGMVVLLGVVVVVVGGVVTRMGRGVPYISVVGAD